VCNEGITQFYLSPTHEPYLFLLPSRKASPPFDWYTHCAYPRRDGQAELTWVAGPHRQLNPDTVTHLSTNIRALVVFVCFVISDLLRVFCYYVLSFQRILVKVR